MASKSKTWGSPSVPVQDIDYMDPDEALTALRIHMEKRHKSVPEGFLSIADWAHSWNCTVQEAGRRLSTAHLVGLAQREKFRGTDQRHVFFYRFKRK